MYLSASALAVSTWGAIQVLPLPLPSVKKSKEDNLYYRGSLQFNRIASEPQLYNTPLFTGPYAAATVRRFSMKALARYQVILLGEQRHIRCEQLAQGCPNTAAAGVEPATSRSRVRRPTTTPPSQ